MSTDKISVDKKQAGGYSYSQAHSIVYTWEINEITQFIEDARSSEVYKLLHSPDFSTGAKIKDSWLLQLIIKKDDETSKNKSWISLDLVSRNGQLVKSKFSLFLLNDKNEKIVKGSKVNQSSDAWIRHNFPGQSSSRGFAHFIKIDELIEKRDEFLQNDTLTVCVDLTVYDEYVTANNPVLESLEPLNGTLGEDFKNLFFAPKNCDVVITVGKEKFEAHKIVLSTRSSVFEAMFSHNMKENKENKVDIPDVDSEVFKKVLEFIYTDKVQDLENSADELLEASDKYQLHGLKSMCEASLAKSLSLTNAVGVLVLADHHNAERLKKFTIDFVVKNLAKFKSTEEYQKLEESQLRLAYALIKKFVDEGSQ